MVHRNAWGTPAPKVLDDVDPGHFDSDGPPHPDRVIEVEIILWQLGYRDDELLATEMRAAAKGDR